MSHIVPETIDAVPPQTRHSQLSHSALSLLSLCSGNVRISSKVKGKFLVCLERVCFNLATILFIGCIYYLISVNWPDSKPFNFMILAVF